MDNDFASKLQSVLSNPDAMSKITAIASSLGSGENPNQSPPSPAESNNQSQFERQANPVSQALFPQSDPRIALLNSIKPLLREEKRGRVDSLLNALTVASMLKSFKK